MPRRAQAPNGRSVRHASASPASGSTHRNVPLRPKCPNVRRRVAAARPVRRLASPHLEAQPPVVGILEPEARAARRGARGRRRRPPRPPGPLRQRPRRQQLEREQGQVGRRPHESLGRATLQPRPGHPERLQHPSTQHFRERPSCRCLQRLTQRVEPRVGVDPRPARLREHAAVEAVSPRVRQQVADRRAGWPGRRRRAPAHRAGLPPGRRRPSSAS